MCYLAPMLIARFSLALVIDNFQTIIFTLIFIFQMESLSKFRGRKSLICLVILSVTFSFNLSELKFIWIFKCCLLVTTIMNELFNMAWFYLRCQPMWKGYAIVKFPEMCQTYHLSWCKIPDTIKKITFGQFIAETELRSFSGN